MTELAIETNGLTRVFGEASVLRGLDLKVKRGSIYGFLGRNGSGKTTTLKILAGLAKPTSGQARVLGGNPWEFGAKERQNLGYLSEKQVLPPLKTVQKLIAFCAQFYPEWDRQLCENLVSKFQLPLKTRVNKLSLGNQRILGIILALAPRPDVLLLDEPAANLDVVARREFLDEILSLIREGGKTVFFSTHILSDVERVADEIGILSDGVLKVSESIDDLKDSVKQVRFHTFTGIQPTEIPGSIRERRENGEILAVLKISEINQPATLAARWGCQAEIQDLGLEDIFVEITRTSKIP